MLQLIITAQYLKPYRCSDKECVAHILCTQTIYPHPVYSDIWPLMFKDKKSRQLLQCLSDEEISINKN